MGGFGKGITLKQEGKYVSWKNPKVIAGVAGAVFAGLTAVQFLSTAEATELTAAVGQIVSGCVTVVTVLGAAWLRYRNKGK